MPASAVRWSRSGSPWPVEAGAAVLEPWLRSGPLKGRFFVYGFAKNERANINDLELKALKLLAKELLNYSAASLSKAMKAGELIEIEVMDDG